MAWKVALTALYALVLTGWIAGRQFDLDPPGLLYDVWYGSGLAWMILGIAPLVGFAVGRWWVLLAVAAPVLALVLLDITGHQSPWSEGLQLSLPLFIVMAAWFGLPLALGIIGRRSRDRWAHGPSNQASTGGV